ncbi:MAG TPA: non-canonical purine NTP pyrophosphatase [Ktedonobacterales bacterium]
MIDTVTFITSNLAKVRLLNQYLAVPVVHKSVDLTEIQSIDLSAIVEHKAREAYQHVRSPVLIEDASLRFLALGRLPGPLIKWFLTELGTDGLCHLLDNYPDRSALTEVQFCLYDGQSFHTFANAQKGAIASTPRGSNGFGWDSIFIPTGYQITWAEMTDEDSQATSLRKPALKKLEAYLKAQTV